MKTCLFCEKKIEESNDVCPYCGSVKFDKGSKNPLYQFNCKFPYITKSILLSFMGIIASVVLFCTCFRFSQSPSSVCNHEYSKKITIEATFEKSGEVRLLCKKCGYSTFSEITPKLPSVEVTVLNKSTRTEEQRLSPNEEFFIPIRHIIFDFEIKNVSGRDIKAVEGTLFVKFGRFTSDFTCRFDDFLPAGETIRIDSYSFNLDHIPPIGDSRTNAMMIFSTSHAGLQYEFNVSDITFNDESKEG